MLAAHHEGLVGTIIDPVASSAQPSRAKLGVTTMGFMDMREWISLLEKAGELRRVTAEVNWDREIGAVARRVLEKKGPALLFENIKGYGRQWPLHPTLRERSWCPLTPRARARFSA